MKTRRLSTEQVAQYERDGFLHPIPVLSPGEVHRFRRELEAWEHDRGAPIDFPEKSKSYLLFDWADQLVHHGCTRKPALGPPAPQLQQQGGQCHEQHKSIQRAERRGGHDAAPRRAPAQRH